MFDPTFHILREEKTTVSGVEAIKAVFKVDISHEEQWQAMMVCLVWNGTAWCLSFTLASACWDQYSETFNNIVNHFRILGNGP